MTLRELFLGKNKRGACLAYPSFDYRSNSYNSLNCKQIHCKGGAIIRTSYNFFG